MSVGLDRLKHLVVLMMENRSFDHMLGGLSLVLEDGKKKYPGINGLSGDEWNPDTEGKPVQVQPLAKFQSQLDPDPDHHFPGVHRQIFGGVPSGSSNRMKGFVQDYFTQTNNVKRSHNIMSYFPPEKLPVLTTLATQFAVFNGWFSSIPGPTICNRAFAHYGTSFGQVGMDIFYILDTAIASVYERMLQAGHTAKIYYYDQQSSTMEIVNLLKNQPQIFADYRQFIADCENDHLPEFSFVEPCYNDHAGPDGGEVLASDQHPDHNIQAGEQFIARIYNAIRTSPAWDSTALLIVYDEHGGIYDHVEPPACTPDGYCAQPASTETGEVFNFDRLGIRVPAVLVSPYIPKGTIVPGTESAAPRIFEHASIPATVTKYFLKGDAKQTARERAASTFLDLLSDEKRPDSEIPFFKLEGV